LVGLVAFGAAVLAVVVFFISISSVWAVGRKAQNPGLSYS
jgi:hypothetical protein